MRSLLTVTVLLGLLAIPALAQTPQQDPQIMIYRQLLDSANSQLAAVAAQLQQAQAKIKELEQQKQPEPNK